MYSEDGFTFIDDSDSLILDNNGNFVKVKQQQIENMGLSNTLSDFLNYTYNNYKLISFLMKYN